MYVQLLIVGLISASIYFKLTRRRNQIKLNEPPLVYYRFPIIGHTWSYLTDCEKLISESREKYGETFTLYVFGQIMTITGKETTQEIFKNDQDFSFTESSDVKILLDYVFPNLLKVDKCTDKALKVVRNIFIVNLNHLTSRLQKHITNTIDSYIGECVEPKVISKPYELLSTMISIIAANLIVGDECYHYNDILETFRNLTFSVLNLFFIPKLLFFIHPWFHQQLTTIPLRFISSHRDVIISRIKPVVKKRLEAKKKLGDAWIAPVDALQLLLNDPNIAPNFDPNNVNYDYIADLIGLFIFAAMSTTTVRASHALHDLAVNQDYLQELYEEAKEINDQCKGNELTSDDIAKMVKLDSFVKEALRLNADLLGVPHKCLSEPYYTFSNGYQIPNGRVVMLNFLEISGDEELQGQNPQQFNAYRHLERNSNATKLERNFVIFGSGKHSCPGRFYAVRVMKIFFHKIILKYHIRAETEKISKKHIGSLIAPLKTNIFFENRD